MASVLQYIILPTSQESFGMTHTMTYASGVELSLPFNQIFVNGESAIRAIPSKSDQGYSLYTVFVPVEYSAGDTQIPKFVKDELGKCLVTIQDIVA